MPGAEGPLAAKRNDPSGGDAAQKLAPMVVTTLLLTLVLSLAARARADGIPCERFLALPEEARAAYVWGLVDGAMAIRASYQLDVRLLRSEGDERHAEQSDFVAQAIAEKLRPALHRPASELIAEIEARCKEYQIPVRTVLAYLDTLDRWRREP